MENIGLFVFWYTKLLPANPPIAAPTNDEKGLSNGSWDKNPAVAPTVVVKNDITHLLIYLYYYFDFYEI